MLDTMTLFNANLKKEFIDRGETEVLNELCATYDELLSKKVSIIDNPNNAPAFTKKRVEFNCKVLQQILLHRAIHLFEASVIALSYRNVYAMVLCIRGHYEGTASMGYLHQRITSFIEGTLRFDDFEKCVFIQAIGCRHKSLPKIADPKNIMTQLDYADKIVDKLFLDNQDTHRGILRDNYEFLSEFAHPNFHSNSVAFGVNKINNCAEFKYDETLKEQEFSLIGYLSISNMIFLWLYDKFSKSLNDFPK